MLKECVCGYLQSGFVHTLQILKIDIIQLLLNNIKVALDPNF